MMVMRKQVTAMTSASGHAPPTESRDYLLGRHVQTILVQKLKLTTTVITTIQQNLRKKLKGSRGLEKQMDIC